MNDIVTRPWGYWKVLHEEDQLKIKSLVVGGKHSLSMQRHFLRSEHWFVLSGSCIVLLKDNDGDEPEEVVLNTHSSITIPVNKWHRLVNPHKNICTIIETQYGKGCVEFDIQREGEK